MARVFCAMHQFWKGWMESISFFGKELRLGCCLAVLLSGCADALSQGVNQNQPTTDLEFRQGLAIGAVGHYGRNAFHTDPIEELIVAGRWSQPRVGDAVAGQGGTNHAWQVVEASADGTFTNRAAAGGYVYVPVKLATGGVRVLEAEGHNVVYVNDEPRVGDPYSNGILQLPVGLRAGTNDFLFQVGRGRLKAKLVMPRSPVMLNLRDPTFPDVIRGEKGALWGAVVVVNCTSNFLKDLSLRASCGGNKPVENWLPPIPPLTSRKVGFRMMPGEAGATNVMDLTLDLARKESSAGESLDSAKTTVRVRRPEEHYKQTFYSDIDGSVQYFAVAPAQPLSQNRPARALFLSAHGAGVEAMGQADAYASKTWGTLVAPTNRRPYGFDWEDWGRHDAMEVLELALAKFKTDPRQTYLTGHSMGGHGAWQLGVTFPDRFGAIAPSAGWISFWSYAGAERTENGDAVQRLLQRAGNPGDTLALETNYLHYGVYILHGDKDDNVPVSEARTMKEHLSRFHHDFMYHEQPGAGHWWGNACVDWPPIFDFFARHQIPGDQSVLDIDFSTMNPGVSASSHWVTIAAQQHALSKSSVVIHCDPVGRAFEGTTENVARLALALDQFPPGGPVTVKLDGAVMEKVPQPGRGQKIWFERRNGGWTPADAPSLAEKGPHRCGPFKEAFGNRMVFVYGTQGDAGENAWAFAKARFDAETWWYRGNGSVDVVPDVSFDAASERDRGVVIYGNADNNSAWTALLAGSPVQVRRGVVRIGAREEHGGDLACLFCRPRPGSDHASVAVISGSGLAGLKLTDRVPYFMAGVAYSDCTVFGIETLRKGSAGVKAAGFFGNDWSVERGEFAWRN